MQTIPIPNRVTNPDANPDPNLTPSHVTEAYGWSRKTQPLHSPIGICQAKGTLVGYSSLQSVAA